MGVEESAPIFFGEIIITTLFFEFSLFRRIISVCDVPFKSDLLGIRMILFKRCPYS